MKRIVLPVTVALLLALLLTPCASALEGGRGSDRSVTPSVIIVDGMELPKPGFVLTIKWGGYERVMHINSSKINVEAALPVANVRGILILSMVDETAAPLLTLKAVPTALGYRLIEFSASEAINFTKRAVVTVKETLTTVMVKAKLQPPQQDVDVLVNGERVAISISGSWIELRQKVIIDVGSTVKVQVFGKGFNVTGVIAPFLQGLVVYGEVQGDGVRTARIEAHPAIETLAFTIEIPAPLGQGSVVKPLDPVYWEGGKGGEGIPAPTLAPTPAPDGAKGSPLALFTIVKENKATLQPVMLMAAILLGFLGFRWRRLIPAALLALLAFIILGGL